MKRIVKVVDLSGNKYNKWTVISYSGSSKWNCVCDCGNYSQVATYQLKAGTSKSCGCTRKEILLNNRTKHGQAKSTYKSSIHTAWQNMKKRCYSITNKHYKNYGGRGITICERWLNSFENFYADMGDKPTEKHTIERINNDGNYEPSNCRWATREDQQANKRIRKDALIHEGKTTNEWAKKLGISTEAAYYRIKTHGTPYLDAIRGLKEVK